MHANWFPIQMFQYFCEGLHFSAFHYNIFVPVGRRLLACLVGVGGGGSSINFQEQWSRILTVTQDPRSHEYLVQRIAVAVQRGNAAAVLGSISSGG